MKIISMSEKKFNDLKELKLSREIVNTEGVIYEINYRGDPKILKKLHHLSGPIFANKLYTLEMLDTNKEYLPNNFCVPDYLCTVNSEIVGFTTPKLEGTNLATILKSKEIDYKGQIYYLKKIGELLNQLHNIRKYTPLKEIYIGDLHEANFIVDNKNRELKVIDLDSCKIGSNKPFNAKYLTPKSILNGIDKYKIYDKDNQFNLENMSVLDMIKSENLVVSPYGYMIADSNTDLYCYSIMILNYLYGSNVGNMSINQFYKYLNYLEYIGVNKELIECFSKLLANCKNESPVNYLDSLDSNQISRAKKLVYDKVRKK